jgi:DNA repair protein RadC
MLTNLALNPREKLTTHSSSSLTDVEILMLLLRTGTKGETVYQLAQRCLQQYSLRELSQRTFKELQNIKGISFSKASVLLAAFECSKRILVEKRKIQKLQSSQQVFTFASPHLSHLPTERVAILLVNAKCEMIRYEEISSGGVHFSFFNLQKAIKLCLDYHAHGFFLLHNHPSGNPQPSQEDKAVTKKVQQISSLLSLAFLDHIIIAQDKYYSFFDDNCL